MARKTKRDIHTQGECETPGCENLQVITNYNYRGTGKPHYRKWCKKCHTDRTVSNHDDCNTIGEIVAKNAGFDSPVAYNNSRHPYRKHKKSYCENIDSRLDYECPFDVELFKEYPSVLEVDHIDGNPENNDESNLQTLCRCCHDVKTCKNGDRLTPGRKTLKEDKPCDT